MATLWIREYNSLPKGHVENGGGRSEVAMLPMEPGVDQTVTFTTSAQSAAFADETRYAVIISDVAYHYVVGDDPTATTAALRLPAGMPYFVGVRPGQKIAAIAAA